MQFSKMTILGQEYESFDFVNRFHYKINRMRCQILPYVVRFPKKTTTLFNLYNILLF